MSGNKKILLGILGFMAIGVIGFASLILYLFSDVIRENRELALEDQAPIETRKLNQKNPTSYTFDVGLKELREKIIPPLETPKYGSPFPFKPYENSALTGFSNFYLCDAKGDGCLGSNEAEFEEIFKKKENENDIYYASDGMPILSSTYYALGKQLEFRMDFHIHLEEIEDNKTKVTIFPIKPVVYKGKGGRGMHGGALKKQIPVEPTTVEEYQLLRYIGFVLGEKEMPEVILPK